MFAGKDEKEFNQIDEKEHVEPEGGPIQQPLRRLKTLQDDHRKNAFDQVLSKISSSFLPKTEEDKMLAVSKYQISETNPYDFAVVLLNGIKSEEQGSFPFCWKKYPIPPEVIAQNREKARADLIEVSRRLSSNGIAIDLLHDTEDTHDSQKYTVLLLRMSQQAMMEMELDMRVNRWIQAGCVGNLNLEEEIELTYAEKVQNGEQIIKSAGVREGELSVSAVIPLYCQHFQQQYLSKFMENINLVKLAYSKILSIKNSRASVEPNQPESIKMTPQTVVDLSGDPASRPISNSVSSQASQTNNWMQEVQSGVELDTDFFVYELRRHLGDQAGLYFAFINTYTDWIFPIAFIGAIIWLVSYGISYRAYHQVLAVWGLLVSGIWGPLFLKFWTRKNNELNIVWGTLESTEAEYINPNFNPEQLGMCSKLRRKRKLFQAGVIDQQDLQKVLQEKVIPDEEDDEPSFFDRLPAYLFLAFFSCIMIIIMLAVTGSAVHIYMILKTMPSCDSAKAGEMCFTGFTRWLVILAQGAALGLIVDVLQWAVLKGAARYFTNLENYKYEWEWELHYTAKVFGFEWLAMYFWFFTLSFLYVPFGKEWAIWLRDNLGEKWSYKYEVDTFDLSEAFVTPLIVTQALNFLLETFVPYLLNEILHAKRYSRSNTQVAVPAVKENAENVAETLSAVTNFKVKALVNCGPGQHIFADVIRESKLDVYTTFSDYDDMVMQFGYITMFSVVWPLIPFFGWLNNIFEIRGDAFKIFYQYRRPLPRRASDIGTWFHCLRSVAILSVMMNAVLICLSTGHLEYYYSDCQLGNEIVKRFGPDFGCFTNNWAARVTAGFVLEHIGLIAQLVILYFIPAQPGWVRKRMRTMHLETKKQLAEKTKESFAKLMDEKKAKSN